MRVGSWEPRSCLTAAWHRCQAMSGTHKVQKSEMSGRFFANVSGVSALMTCMGRRAQTCVYMQCHAIYHSPLGALCIVAVAAHIIMISCAVQSTIGTHFCAPTVLHTCGLLLWLCCVTSPKLHILRFTELHFSPCQMRDRAVAEMRVLRSKHPSRIEKC